MFERATPGSETCLPKGRFDIRTAPRYIRVGGPTADRASRAGRQTRAWVPMREAEVVEIVRNFIEGQFPRTCTVWRLLFFARMERMKLVITLRELLTALRRRIDRSVLGDAEG